MFTIMVESGGCDLKLYYVTPSFDSNQVTTDLSELIEHLAV